MGVGTVDRVGVVVMVEGRLAVAVEGVVISGVAVAPVTGVWVSKYSLPLFPVTTRVKQTRVKMHSNNNGREPSATIYIGFEDYYSLFVLQVVRRIAL